LEPLERVDHGRVVRSKDPKMRVEPSTESWSCFERAVLALPRVEQILDVLTDVVETASRGEDEICVNTVSRDASNWSQII
jgi:hypothetical protein